MATSAYVESLMGGLSADVRRAFRSVFDYVLGNLRFGPCDDATRTENFQLYAFEATTPAVANTEFSIAHGLKDAPHLVIPVLRPGNVGEKIVDLAVTRVADGERIYLKSSVASAPICVLIEV
jgi:hypothetical protein